MRGADLVKERITVNSDISFGKPCIRNTRYSVEMIIDLLASGMTREEILIDYQDLEREDITASLILVGKLLKVKSLSRALEI